VTEEEYKGNAVLCPDPKKKRAKLSHSSRGKANSKTSFDTEEDDRKPAAVAMPKTEAAVAANKGTNGQRGAAPAPPSEIVPCVPDAIDSSSDEASDSDEAARDVFMAAPLFHLNSFMNATTRRNKGFGPFIREQVATPGFYAVGQHVIGLLNQGGTYEEIRNELIHHGGPDEAGVDPSEASQVTLWLTEVKVGSYILMRHEYKSCPWVPTRLKDDQGEYIGKVWVLGRVTAVVEPDSDEKEAIAANLPEINDTWCNTFCRVKFDKMILKSNLKTETVNYISKVCQKTLSKICVEGSSWLKLGTDARTVRDDIWNNANISICSDDFDEYFGVDADMSLEN